VPTIFIVDDDPSMRRMLRLIFEEEGLAVFTAANGLEALASESVRAGEIDIVITDVMMPEMDGLTLAENLKRQYPDLPVLILSGCSDYLDIGSSNATEIMAKPFEVTALLGSVRRLLSKRVSRVL